MLGVGSQRRQRRHGAGITQVAEREDRHLADMGVVVSERGQQRNDRRAVTELAEAPRRHPAR